MNDSSDEGNFLRIEIHIPNRGLDMFRHLVKDVYSVDKDIAERFKFNTDRWVFEDKVQYILNFRTPQLN